MKRRVYTNSKNLLEAIKADDLNCDDCFVFDNFSKDEEILGYQRIPFEELKKNKNQYHVIITNSAIGSIYALCKQMRDYGIDYQIYNKDALTKNTLHISGVFRGNVEDLDYKWNRKTENREIYIKLEKQIEGLFKSTFERYKNDFLEKHIDLYYYLEDMPQDAYRIAMLLGIEHIFSCCTVYPVSMTVIPIPNYFACYDEKTYQWPDESPSRIRQASQKKWEDIKAVWIGDVKNSPDDLRRMLLLLGEKNPDKLKIINSEGFWQQTGDGMTQKRFFPMTDLPRYKYLIDIRGWSFYARMTRLLQMNRVVLRVESIYSEWYDNYLIPMKHFVPIKSDMSDLLTKIDYLENNPDIYSEISEGAREFTDRYLNREAYLCCVRDAVLKYGIQK